MARLRRMKRGKASPLCPCSSDVDLFRDGESIIDLNPEIADSAFDLGVTEQELHGSQITSTAVDQGCLRMTIMRDHSKALDSLQLSNNFRHRMPAGAGRVGSN